jgi:eukaryotic-like serine/threonine-protein kinase
MRYDGGRRAWTRRVSVALLILGLASAALTALRQLELPRGSSLAGLFVVLAAVIEILERLLREHKPDWERQIRQEKKEIKRRAPGERRRVLDLVRQIAGAEDPLSQYWEQSKLPLRLAHIQLRFASRPSAVDSTLPSLPPPNQGDQLLELGVSISAIYRQVHGHLLILGNPGAGKTTQLYELTQTLLFEAIRMPDQPMPVIFSLSSWAVERQNLAAWLGGELHKRYLVPHLVAQSWVRNAQVIPLLDGLDEVRAEDREACVKEINRFHGEYVGVPLVVCSRVAEYEALPVRLRLDGAVVVQPLARVAVEDYLAQQGRRHGGVLTVLSQDESMWELLTSPLFLRVVAITYLDRPAAAARPSDTLKERERLVLADYVKEMFRRRSSSAAPVFPKEETETWLTWLARTMLVHGQSVFYLDWMQPDWLPTQMQRRLVTVGTAVAAGFLSALIVALGDTLIGMLGGLSDWSGRLVSGLTVGLIVGLAGYGSAITPTERLRWSWAALLHNAPRVLAAGFLAGLIFGIVISLIIGLIVQPSPGELATLLVGAPVSGVVVALATGFFFSPVSALRPQLYVTPTAPGHGMRTSKRNALRSGLVGGLLGVLAGGLLGWLIGLQTGVLSFNLLPAAGAFATKEVAGRNVALIFALENGLEFGLALGLIAWLRRGGGAYVRHYTLRALLAHNGMMPLDYSAFLNYTTGLILLQARGGGYEFIHRVLLEYFATLQRTDQIRQPMVIVGEKL